uniref:PDZ domain-containing protein n=1 Tax=Echinostoma caproni TaxID=27848 RepID=A0A183ACG0_9TREM
LGFTLTRRDTKTSAESSDPVYVKKILPTGAAIQDGRLQIGDRLLSVDGVDVSNMDQVLAQLRAVTPGRIVKLVISRQAAALADDTVSGRKSGVQSVSNSMEDPDLNSVDLPPRPFRSFTYEFRLPRKSTGTLIKPTLGVNFKWGTAPPDSDNSTSPIYAPLPGLYVESLLPEGLVMQAGRPTLLPGDRLVGLNGENLDGLSAKEISTKIRKVLNSVDEQDPEGKQSGSVPSPRPFSLTVHRYHGLQRQSTDSMPRASLRNRRSVALAELSSSSNPALPDQYANTPFLTDSRRRRSSLFEDAHDRSRLSSSSSAEGMSKHSASSPRYMSVPPRMFSGVNPYFEREGFGRRSVSEKRHGQVDAAKLPFFQTQILPSRYKMPEDVDKQYSTMPTTRRLKIHRERMAALAASNAGIVPGGPVKALHPSDLSKPADPGAQCISDCSNRDEDLPSRDTMSLFRRGRKQNSSFRNAVDRSLNLGETSVSRPSENNTNRIGRSRSASRVPSSPIPNSCTQSVSTDASQSQRLTLSQNHVTDSHHSAKHSRPTTPALSPDVYPPVPPRQELLPARTTPTSNVKPAKRSFGGIRGLFRSVLPGFLVTSRWSYDPVLRDRCFVKIYVWTGGIVKEEIPVNKRHTVIGRAGRRLSKIHIIDYAFKEREVAISSTPPNPKNPISPSKLTSPSLTNSTIMTRPTASSSVHAAVTGSHGFSQSRRRVGDPRDIRPVE